MKKTSVVRLISLSFAAGSAVALPIGAPPAADDAVTIGFVTDFSGLYADNDGPGGLEAIRMVIADFGGQVNGKSISCSMPIIRTRQTSPRRVRVSGPIGTP